MRTITAKKTEGFQIKSTPVKSITNNQADIIKKALEEAKRQAYSDMGFNF